MPCEQRRAAASGIGWHGRGDRNLNLERPKFVLQQGDGIVRDAEESLSNITGRQIKLRPGESPDTNDGWICLGKEPWKSG